MKQYYGGYVEDCLFWVTDQPAELPLRSYWESTPMVRDRVKKAEEAAAHNKALMCLQRYVRGTPMYDWLKNNEINAHIQEILDITIDMLRREGKIVDISSFARDNIRIDEDGYPHIIDPTYLIDIGSDRMTRVVKSLGYTSYEEVQPNDLLTN